MAVTAVPFRHLHSTCDPRNIQTILATSFRDFGLGSIRLSNLGPLLGQGIFASNGKKWEHSRAMLRPQFARSQVSDLSLEETHVQSLMDVLDTKLIGGSGSDSGWTSVVDLKPLFFHLTLDSATEFLFGESVNSQKRVEGDLSTNQAAAASAFAASFDASQKRIALAGSYGPMYWLKHNAEFRDNVRICHEFIDYFVQRAVAKRQDTSGSFKTENEGKDGERKERYVFLEAMAEETSDPVEMRSQLLNILLAGRDTTASTLSWFMYIMAQPQNRPIYERLREAVLDAFGTYREPREITFEGLKSLRYLQWCVNETLRLFPIVPLNARTALRDTVLPVGGGADGQSPILIKKGEDVSYSVDAMHRRTDLWGTDADEFRPERWEKRRPGWEYLPFNGGPRICLGQQFALTEIAYVVVRLVQRVDELDGSELSAVKHGLALTNSPGQGVPVRLHFVE